MPDKLGGNAAGVGAAPPILRVQKSALVDDLEAAVGIADRAGFWRQLGQGGRGTDGGCLFHTCRTGRNAGGAIAAVSHALVFDPFAQWRVHIDRIDIARQVISARGAACTGRVAHLARRHISGRCAAHLVGDRCIAQGHHLAGGCVTLDRSDGRARFVIQRQRCAGRQRKRQDQGGKSCFHVARLTQIFRIYN